MTWITADWHLGEDRFDIMNRPFMHPEQMVDSLVRLHNSMVSPSDKVIVVGDSVAKHAPDYLSHIARFNGKKILLRGNHDRIFTNEDLSPYFEHILDEGVGMEFDVGGIPCYAVHYPTCGVDDKLNIVGHVHGAWRFQLNAINVGVDVNHFRPLNIDKIPMLYEAINKHYDDDIWAAYHHSNSSFVGRRGKQGQYFTI